MIHEAVDDCPRLTNGSGFEESLPVEAMNIADVSPTTVTFGERNLLISFGSGQNRTQEADGSIPFISKNSFGFNFRFCGRERLRND
jgi:hypothetical protein